MGEDLKEELNGKSDYQDFFGRLAEEMFMRERNGTGATEGTPLFEFERPADFGPSDGSRKYETEPAAYAAPVWRLGWTDGRDGQPEETNKTFLDALAKQRWLQDLSLARRKQAEAKATAEYREEVKDKLAQRRELYADKLKQLEARYGKLRTILDRPRKDDSLLLAMVYLGAAIVFLLADIPLSLNLVAKGFDLNIVAQMPSTGEKVEISQMFTSVASLSDLWFMILQFWEPLILALGIALSGIFVKFFLDEVLWRKKDAPPEQAAAERELNTASAEVGHETPQPNIVRQFIRGIGQGFLAIFRWIRRNPFESAMCIVMLTFLVTIFVLGLYRAETRLQEQIADLEGSIVTAPDGTAIPPNPDDLKRRISEFKEANKWSEWAFILLTFIFPVIGGICFSAGWRRFENAKQRLDARWEIFMVKPKTYLNRWVSARADAAYGAAYQAWREAVASCAHWDQMLSAAPATIMQDQEKAFAELWRSIYQHGYERGFSVPETADAGERWYKRGEHYAQKLLAKNLRDVFWRKRGTRGSNSSNQSKEEE